MNKSGSVITLISFVFLMVGCVSACTSGPNPPSDTGATTQDTSTNVSDTTSVKPPDTGGMTAPVPDTSTPPTDTSNPEPDTPQNCPTPPGAKEIGAECTDHCECGTSYCYDEAFMGITGTFRFCTRECGGDCGDPPEDSAITQYKCYILAGNWTKEYNLTKSHICAPSCSTVEDCKHLSSKYDACGNNGGWTEWCASDGTPHTLSAKTCLVTSEMPDCDF
jgi:hypothetical protein